MLELKKYTRAEITAILGTRNRQGIMRKLEGYGVEYKIEGWGNYTLTITAINDPFKLFCITELGIPAQADFTKIRDLYYYLFCCPGFAEQSFESMAQILDDDNRTISSKTIAKWVAHLGHIDYVAFDKEDCKYYAITKTADGRRESTEITAEVYRGGWQIYWNQKAEHGTQSAYLYMYNFVGGHPKKQAIMKPNAFYINEINYMIDLIQQSFMK